MTGPRSIDWRRFGSHWLGDNLISDSIFVDGVQRAVGRRAMTVHRGTARVDPFGVEPARRTVPGADDPFSFVRWLLAGHPGPLVLALSGGIDSRLLLALALECRSTDSFRAVTFGSADSQDVRIAAELARKTGITHEIIPAAGLRDLATDGTLARVAADHGCAVPTTFARHAALYGRVFGQASGATLVDGAFGEIGRASYYRRIEAYRRLTVGRFGSPARIRRLLGRPRADIFNADAARLMEEGFLEDAAVFAEQLGAADTRRPEDEVAARYRRRNFFGFGQAWIDRFGRNVMPFGQDSFIDPVLRLTRPVDWRRGRLYRRTIERIAPMLAEVDLAKGSTTRPFHGPSMVARLRRRTTPTTSDDELRDIRDFVFDRIESASFRGFDGYDHDAVRKLVERHFATGEGRADVDWFLAFDLWRTGNSIV